MADMLKITDGPSKYDLVISSFMEGKLVSFDTPGTSYGWTQVYVDAISKKQDIRHHSLVEEIRKSVLAIPEFTECRLAPGDCALLGGIRSNPAKNRLKLIRIYALFSMVSREGALTTVEVESASRDPHTDLLLKTWGELLLGGSYWHQ